MTKVLGLSDFQSTDLSEELREFLQKSINSTELPGKDLDLFLHCWSRQSCDSCLSTIRPCAWCTTSMTCVPNERLSYPFGILAPIGDENICPLAYKERWEMRARPFSCRCSTMTLISVVVAVLSTLLGVLLLWLSQRIFRWSYRRWRKREAGWWRVRRPRWNGRFWQGSQLDGAVITATTEDEEQSPLLG